MMKRLKYIVSALLLPFFFGCVEPASILHFDEGDNQLAEFLDRYEVEYGLRFNYEFDKSDFAPVGYNRVLSYKTTTDIASIVKVLDYFEDNVLSFMPKEFIFEYMPRTVLLVDSLIGIYEYDDKIEGIKWSRNYAIPSYVTDRYLAIGNVNTHFDTNDAGLKEELISAVVERLLSNDYLPPLTDFVNATEDALKACKVQWQIAIGNTISLFAVNYPYWNGISSALYKTWNMEKEDYTRWLAWSVLKPGRCGYMGFNDDSKMGIRLTSYEYDKGTIQKDFGDFTAFILTKTPAEKEAFYAAVAAHNELPDASADMIEKNQDYLVYRDGKYYDGRFPYYGGEIGANAIRKKVEIVKSWWQGLGITLKEPM